jgi:hypothetical protein
MSLSAGKNLLSWGPVDGASPFSGNQHQHKIGYMNQPSVGVKTNFKIIKNKFYTHEA